MASGGMIIVKYLLFIFNFIFWLSGLALIIVGALVKKEYGYFLNVSSSSNFASAPVFLIVVGVIVAVVGFLGCCGAIKENYCMVTTFAVLLGLIFILEIAAGALAYTYRGKMENIVKDALEKGVKNYNATEYKKFMDQVQKDFKCCGYKEGAKDYINEHEKVPDSCAGNNTTTNCVKGLEESLKSHLMIIGGVGIGIAFIQLVGILFACCMMRSIKKEYEVM